MPVNASRMQDWKIQTNHWCICIPHLHKTDLAGDLGGHFPYQRWSPFCLGRAQFSLLLTSVSSGLELHLFK